jgi:hypothetical protein
MEKAPRRSARRDQLVIAARLPRVGRVQRQVRRALVAAGGRPLSTTDLLRWSYPHLRRFECWRCQAVRRAAPKYAVPVGRRRSRGLPIMWAPNAKLLRLIAPRA